MVLKKLLAVADAHGYEICAVLTNPPSARGRHKELIPTEVARTAAEHDISVFAFDPLRAEAREALSPLGADILVCFDYGRIFGQKFLALFPLGGINLHPSALPRYRGCTPVPAALLAGDAELGVAVQKLALDTDAGDILARASLSLDGTETTQSLLDGDGTHSAVTDCGAELLDGVLSGIAAGAQTRGMGSEETAVADGAVVSAALLAGDTELGISVQKLALETDSGDILARASKALVGTETTQSLMDGDGTQSAVTDCGARLLDEVLSAASKSEPFALPTGTPQSGEASYTPFIKKEDGRIDWTHTAADIDRQIRAYTPWPLCSTVFTAADGTSTNLLILRAHPGEPAPDAVDAAAAVPAGTVLPYRKAVGIEIACGGGTVLVATELQWQAKKAMDYKSFMNGARSFVGSVLGA